MYFDLNLRQILNYRPQENSCPTVIVRQKKPLLVGRELDCPVDVLVNRFLILKRVKGPHCLEVLVGI